MTEAVAPDIDLVGIVAVADNGVIGRDGEIPWHHPEDMRHFKEVTTGHPVIMGRVTYEGILEGLGEPLPDRTSIVLTGRSAEAIPQSEEPSVVVVADLEEAIDAAETASRERHHGAAAFVAGGASVYEQLLPHADRLVVTEVHDEPPGDTYFPFWDRAAWRETDREDHGNLSFVTYERS